MKGIQIVELTQEIADGILVDNNSNLVSCSMRLKNSQKLKVHRDFLVPCAMSAFNVNDTNWQTFLKSLDTKSVSKYERVVAEFKTYGVRLRFYRVVAFVQWSQVLGR